MASSFTFKLPGTRPNLSSFGVVIVLLWVLSTAFVVEIKATLNATCIGDNDCTLHEVCFEKKCVCQTDAIEEAGACRLPKHDEQCQSGCESPLVCESGFCACALGNYYDTTQNTCQANKGIGQPCNDTSMPCFSQFVCKSEVCKCKEDEFSPEDYSCQSRKSFGAVCTETIDNECKANLACVDRKCGCIASQFYDRANTLKCQPRKDKEASCSNITNECKAPFSCVFDSPTNGKCACSQSQYYAESTCNARKDKEASCSDIAKECKDPFSCFFDSPTNRKCACSQSQYYAESTCNTRKDKDAVCTTGGSQKECKDTLSCVSGTCQCNQDEYYDGSACRTRKDKDAVCTTGGSQKECKDTLSCVSGTCQCNQDEYYDGSACRTRKDKDAVCTTGGSQKECKDKLNCVSGTCQCNQDEYYDGSACRTRKDKDAVCTTGGSQKECKDTLSCVSGTCQCNQDEYYDGSACRTRKNHAETCSYNDECFVKDHMECINSKCLCGDAYFYWGQTTPPCAALEDLKVQGLGVHSKTTTTMDIRWSTSVHHPSIKYKINTLPDEGHKVLSDTGGTLSGLNPGTKYDISIESYIEASEHYGKKSTSVGTTAWTFPSSPGTFDPNESNLVTSPYTFAFGQAIGNVASYKVSVTRSDVLVEEKNVATLKVTLKNLSPATTYMYEIIAVNGNGDESEAQNGTFDTSAAASSRVEEFSIKDITKNEAHLEWKAPTERNGVILFYVAQVKKDGSCISSFYLTCSDCGPLPEVPNICGQSINRGGFSTSDDEFLVTVSDLSPYTMYTIQVFAANKAGAGHHIEQSFTTKESAANKLVELNVTPFRGNANKIVGLTIQWTPGDQTGQTSYTVTLQDKADATSSDQAILEGYENTSKTFSNLLAYHMYHVEVFAETKIGKGDTSRTDVKTETAIPGVVQSLEVIPDQVYAKKMILQFSCPSEPERNGDIKGFSIIQRDSFDQEITHGIISSDCSRAIRVNYPQSGDFQIKHNYTFQVQTKNQDYVGEASDPVRFYTAIKEPVFEKEVLTKMSDVESTKTTIEVSLCSSCLTNNIQGEIIHAGLIICVKSKDNSCSTSRRKRATMDVKDFNDYTTWAKAKSSGFASQYRTTTNTWLTSLNREKPKSFVIGDNPQCSSDSQQTVYCNGPLPTGKEIVVMAISCTEAGCQSQTSGFVLKTKVPSDSSDDATGIIVGVIVAVILIAAIIVVGVLFIRYRKKKKEEPAHLPFKDLSDPQKKPVKIRDFKEHVAMLHKDSNLMFQGEFEDIKNISAEFKATNEEAQRECNRVKNRYVDILPYDHSRVKLGSSSESEDGSDFINASYIPGLNSKREYIASQGPMHATIPDFWRMVWEQKSKVIVMLSDLMENNKMKVNLYWPENLNEPISYGDVVVEMTNFSQLNKYIIRNFKISVGNSNRRVTHFFIPGWWDFSANLTFADVLEFAQLVRKETTPPDSGPLTVHCSAGVGRTGTFIALDYFMQYIDRQALDDDIDVFEYVLKMRKNRPRMVQAETQYIFIFDALVEVIERKIQSEQERLYDNMRPAEENVYANQVVTDAEENVYANQVVTDHVYANATAKDSTIVDFSYSNKAFEPDNFGNDDLSSSNKPTTVL